MDATTIAWIESRVEEYESWLLPAYVEDEQSRQIMRGVFTAAAHIDAFFRQRIIGMRGLISPFALRADWLRFLGDTVGFADDTGIPGHLDERAWRRLIPSAADIWREKGLTYRHMITALTGRPSWIGEWHDVRHILDETPLPHLGIDSELGTANHERTVLIHVEDPIGTFSGYTPAEGEEPVNRTLLEVGLQVIRPIQQRIDVTFYDLVEDQSRGLARWTQIAGSEPEVDADTQILKVPASSTTQHNLGPVTAEMEFGVWEAWVRVTGTTAAAEMRVRNADGNYVWVKLELDDDPWASIVSFGDESGIFGSTPWPVAKGEWVWINLVISDEDTDERVAVHLDGEFIFDDTRAKGHPDTGPTAFITQADSEIEVQVLEQWQMPATTIRIGPNP